MSSVRPPKVQGICLVCPMVNPALVGGSDRKEYLVSICQWYSVFLRVSRFVSKFEKFCLKFFLIFDTKLQ